MASTAKDVKFPLRMLVDKENNEVCFAEANSDFVDILLSFFTLPMGTIIRLLSKISKAQPAEVGSLCNLYESISKLDIKFFGSAECKHMLLNPKNSSEDQCYKLQVKVDDTEPTKYFICQDWSCSRVENALLSTKNTAKCRCGKLMDKQIYFRDKNSGQNTGVFVTKQTSFVIKEGLCVFPISTDFPIIDLAVKDIRVLEEKTVNVGYKEILNLLKCSMVSKTPLADTFLIETESSNMINHKGGHFPLPPQTAIENTTNSSNTVSIKISIKKSNNKVLFAEVEEDFVEFLCSILTTPLGSMMNLLRGNTCLGSMDNFYTSVSNWNIGSPFISNELKDRLVSPQLAIHHKSRNNGLFSLKEADAPSFYCYSYCIENCPRKRFFGYLTLTKGTAEDREAYYSLLTMKKHAMVEGCFVKKPAMFMVTDDLTVSPLSYISRISLLNRSGILSTEIDVQVVEIGKEEALSILKASLNTSEVLTNGLSHILKKPKQEEGLLKAPKLEK